MEPMSQKDESESQAILWEWEHFFMSLILVIYMQSDKNCTGLEGIYLSFVSLFMIL